MRSLLSAILLLCLMGLPAASQTSALATLANSMQPGQWAELQTVGMVAAFTGTGGSTGIINPYATELQRDGVSKCGYFMGSDHGGNYTSLWPVSSYRLVRYCDAGNNWTVMPNPPWVFQDATGYSDAHGYDLTALSEEFRELYRLAYNGRIIHRFSLDSQQWDQLATLPEGTYTMHALAYFPERHALIVTSQSGSIWEMIRPGTAWRDITNIGSTQNPTYINAGLASTWQFVVYNPVLHEVLMGSSTNKLWKYSIAGVMTQLGDIPSAYRTYNGSGNNGLWTVDPVSGKYLIMTDPTNGTGRNVYEYDSASDLYSATSAPPNKHSSNKTNWIATPVPEYGVTLWAWADGNGSAGTYLYRHSDAPLPPPTNNPPTVNVVPDISIVLPAQASLSATVNDDGQPSGNVSYQWSCNQNGVVFSAPTALQTMATFPAPGSYTLALTANDGQLSGSDSLVVTVGSQPSPLLTIPFDTTSQGSDGKFYRIQGTVTEQ